jgi:hypothetical protein
MKREVNLHFNKVSEASLQRMYEEMITEIQEMKLNGADKKSLIAMLLKYRSAWNSYINTIKMSLVN